MLYAFEHAGPATSSCRRRPPRPSATWRRRCANCWAWTIEIRVIGTRHGEKLYETLVSREEMARAEDLGGYYRIPADSRDLNYDKYFIEGETEIAQIEDYTSHNTRRLNVEEVKDVLMKLRHACARPSMLKVMTIVGTRPEIIRLSRVIDRARPHCAHTSWCTPARTTTTS